MKISKDQKDEIRRKIIEAAVDIITEKGFPNATMREISVKAGVGTATIYNYFPTKEKILFAYFLDKHRELIREMEAIPDFAEFTLKEKFQAHIETMLEIYQGDREFVQVAYRMMFDAPMRTFTEFTPVREMFTETAMEFLDSAFERNEIMEHPFKGFIANLYWDYTGLVLLYWLRDESEGFSHTTQLVDMSLDVIVEVLKSGIIVKMTDIFSFLFRNHIYSNFKSITGLFDCGREFGDFFRNRTGDTDDSGKKTGKPAGRSDGQRRQPE